MPKFISVVKFVVKEGEVENFTASMKKFVNPDGVISVSYTHLTLPTTVRV